MAIDQAQRRTTARPAQAAKDKGPATWTRKQRSLMEERRKLAWTAQHAYYERSSILNALNYLMGVPVVIVTVLAGSEIVASHTTDNPVPIWVGIISVSAAVLASLQTFFRFGERAAFNAVAGNEYAKIRRRLEEAGAAPASTPSKEIGEIRTLWEDAGKQMPPIGERRWLTWQVLSSMEQPPRRRSLLRAMLGFPPRRRRRMARRGSVEARA